MAKQKLSVCLFWTSCTITEYTIVSDVYQQHVHKTKLNVNKNTKTVLKFPQSCIS